MNVQVTKAQIPVETITAHPRPGSRKVYQPGVNRAERADGGRSPKGTGRAGRRPSEPDPGHAGEGSGSAGCTSRSSARA